SKSSAISASGSAAEISREHTSSVARVMSEISSRVKSAAVASTVATPRATGSSSIAAGSRNCAARRGKPVTTTSGECIRTPVAGTYDTRRLPAEAGAELGSTPRVPLRSGRSLRGAFADVVGIGVGLDGARGCGAGRIESFGAHGLRHRAARLVRRAALPAHRLASPPPRHLVGADVIALGQRTLGRLGVGGTGDLRPVLTRCGPGAGRRGLRPFLPEPLFERLPVALLPGGGAVAVGARPPLRRIHALLE